MRKIGFEEVGRGSGPGPALLDRSSSMKVSMMPVTGRHSQTSQMGKKETEQWDSIQHEADKPYKSLPGEGPSLRAVTRQMDTSLLFPLRKKSQEA